jgi:hypothetical protein
MFLVKKRAEAMAMSSGMFESVKAGLSKLEHFPKDPEGSHKNMDIKYVRPLSVYHITVSISTSRAFD